MISDFNTTLYNPDFGGFLSFVNEGVGGWFANLFLLMVFIVATYVGSKGEHKMSNVLSLSFLTCFILGMILKLMMNVQEQVLFAIGAGLAISVFWSVIESRG